MISSILKSVWNPSNAVSGSQNRSHVVIPTAVNTGGCAADEEPWSALQVGPVNAKCHGFAADADVDIWVIPTIMMPQIARIHCNLTEAEFTHARRLKYDADRIRFIAVRSLLRQALAFTARSEIEYARADLRLNEFGKPELAAPHGCLSFSIAHAGAFSIIAVAAGGIVGADAEKVEQARLKHLPFDCLSSNEQRHLRALPENRRHFDFFRYWTLKEAYTKALGLGFSAEFDRIEFDLDPIRLESKAPQAGESDTENFDLLSVGFDRGSYFLAICLLNAARHELALKKNVIVCSS